MEFRYKLGDKVVVRSDLSVDSTRYYMESGPKEENGFAYVCYDMKKFCGQVVHIEKYAYGDRYFIKEDPNHHSWTDEMFVGFADNNVKFRSLL